MLKNLIQQIVTHENLEAQRKLVNAMAAELKIELADLAAALMFLGVKEKISNSPDITQKSGNQASLSDRSANIKLIRYRLSVGSKHQATVEQITKVLVDESGVDINNINNINIQDSYTFIELPDYMPQDIFIHLKSVEINQQKLDIKRVKTGNIRKRGKNRSRRGGRHRNSKLVQGSADHLNGG